MFTRFDDDHVDAAPAPFEAGRFRVIAQEGEGPHAGNICACLVSDVDGAQMHLYFACVADFLEFVTHHAPREISMPTNTEVQRSVDALLWGAAAPGVIH